MSQVTGGNNQNAKTTCWKCGLKCKNKQGLSTHQNKCLNGAPKGASFYRDERIDLNTIPARKQDSKPQREDDEIQVKSDLLLDQPPTENKVHEGKRESIDLLLTPNALVREHDLDEFDSITISGEPDGSVTSQILHTPEKPERGTSKANENNKTLKEEQINPDHEKELVPKTPQPPQTPRPLLTRTPNFRTSTTFSPKASTENPLILVGHTPMKEEALHTHVNNNRLETEKDADESIDSPKGTVKPVIPAVATTKNVEFQKSLHPLHDQSRALDTNEEQNIPSESSEIRGFEEVSMTSLLPTATITRHVETQQSHLGVLEKNGNLNQENKPQESAETILPSAITENTEQHQDTLHIQIKSIHPPTMKTSNGKQISSGNNDTDDRVTQLTHEIRQYSMDICKQMRNKLSYLNRKNFQIRNDKGSVSREQVYIDCNTSIYEYLRFNMVDILKVEMNCCEDLRKRKVVTDADILKKSEVEAQYSIQFRCNNTQHNVHVTFYYTKCSIWVQGPSTKIANLTVAQFFIYNYLEKIANMIERTVPLKEVGDTMKEHICQFLSENESNLILKGISNGNAEKCLTCEKKCYDNGKSTRCAECHRKQHFQCASITPGEERESYLKGSQKFLCSKCICHADNNTEPPTQATKKFSAQIELPKTNTSEPEQLINKEDSIDFNLDTIPEVSADKILIRRLQQEMADMVQNHSKKEKELNDEINTLKEAYRRAIADYEKEKDTKETLQQCLEALQKQPGPVKENMAARSRKDNADASAESNRDGNKEDSEESTTKKLCRFFNQRNGCRNKEQCPFEHKKMPTCKKPQCRGRNCKYDHKTEGSGDAAGTTNESSVSSTGNKQKTCHFFNRRMGCRNGAKCRFEHVKISPCPNKDTCKNRERELDHRSSDDIQRENSHQDFLAASPSPKAPDPNAQDIFLKNIELRIQKSVEEAISKRMNSTATPGANQEDPTRPISQGAQTAPSNNLGTGNPPTIPQQQQNSQKDTVYPTKGSTQTSSLNNLAMGNLHPTPQQQHSPIPTMSPQYLPNPHQSTPQEYYQPQQDLQQNRVPLVQPPQQNLYQMYPAQPTFTYPMAPNLYQMNQMQIPQTVNSY